MILKRYICALIVARNWRIRKRLPRITNLAERIGFIVK